MKITRLAMPCLIFVTVACQGNSSDSSTLQQIVSGPDSICTNHTERLPSLTARYSGFVNSYTYEGEKQRAMETFSRLPAPYLEFVFVQSRAALYLTGACQGGLTSWSFDQSGRVPTSISSGTASPGSGCSRSDTLAHEMGHAAYGAVQRANAQFEAALDAQYHWAVYQGGESASLAHYATTSREEYFAELFDTYYCSSAARARLRQYLPRAFALAERFLLAPQ